MSEIRIHARLMADPIADAAERLVKLLLAQGTAVGSTALEDWMLDVRTTGNQAVAQRSYERELLGWELTLSLGTSSGVSGYITPRSGSLSASTSSKIAFSARDASGDVLAYTDTTDGKSPLAQLYRLVAIAHEQRTAPSREAFLAAVAQARQKPNAALD